MNTFTFKLACDEVIRNIKSARLRTLTMLLVCAALGGAVALATISDLNRVTSTISAQYAAGSTLLELTGPAGQRVDAARCHALENVEGVDAAGGVLQQEMIRLGTLPDADTMYQTVTPGYIASVWPGLKTARSTSVIAGLNYQELGWQSGTSFTFINALGATAQATVDTVAPNKSALGHERIIASVSQPSGTVSSCFVLATASTKSNVVQAVDGWFGDGTQVSDVLIRNEFTPNPQDLLDQRMSRFGWAIGGLVLIAAMLSHWVLRRNEFALYRLHHVSDRGIAMMFFLETVVLALIPANIGASLAIGARTLDSLFASSLVLDLLRLDLVLFIAPIIGLMVIPRGSLLSTLKGQ